MKLPNNSSRLLTGLPAQLLLRAILPLTVILIIITVGSFVLHQRAMRDMVQRREAGALRLTVAAFEESLAWRFATLRSSSHDESATDLVSFAFDAGWWHIEDGVIVVRQVDEPDMTSDVLHWLETLESSTASRAWVTLWHGDSGQAVALLAQPLANNVWLVGGFDVTSELASLVQVRSVDRPTTWFQFVDETGQSVALRVSETGDYQSVPQVEWETQAALAQRNPESYIYLEQQITETGWQLNSIEQWEAVGDPLLETTEYIPLLLIPLILVASGLLWYGLRDVVVPLRQLAAKAPGIAAGKYDALDLSVGGIREIQLLQQELRTIAQQVKGAQQGMSDYADTVVWAQEEERNRLAREIHDTTIQSLIALNQRIQLLELQLSSKTELAQVANLEQMATNIIADLRRLTAALRPIYLEDLGLVPALEMLVESISQTYAQPVTSNVTGDPFRLSQRAELALYRVAQEALQNCVQHAAATEITLQLTFDLEATTLEVQDDGRGFHMPQQALELAQQHHYGIIGMVERADLIGGNLQIESTLSRGTTVRLAVPREEEIE